MPRKKRFENKETTVVGLRVPKDMKEEIKEPLREYADFYIETKKTLKDIIKDDVSHDNEEGETDNRE
ncbi:MAG: hypothetical protein ACFFG0_22625 [Candidatus Thorarchaeota archaeon]